MDHVTESTLTMQLYDAAEVRRALELLLPAGHVTELRALSATTGSDRWPHTAVGYFDDAEHLIEALERIHTASGLYITPNCVNPALLARAANRIRKAGKGESTTDTDILSRRWLLIDCDPQRPAGISADDTEHNAALSRASSIKDDLHYNYGWPDPIEADSGNGAHLLYRVDLPCDDDGLLHRCLSALAGLHDNSEVKIDTGVFNPARIWKLYGTRACKGDHTPDRPHRLARILSVPSTMLPVSSGLLHELANEAKEHLHTNYPDNPPAQHTLDIDAFLSEHDFQVDGPHNYNGSGRKWTFIESPLCEHHGDGPYLIQFGNGALAAGCHHNSCTWSWHDLRERFAPKANNELYDKLLASASQNAAPSSAIVQSQRQPIPRVTCAEMCRTHPILRQPVVDGLFRRGETCNVVSTSKVGKSWLVYNLALSIVTAEAWLGRFRTHPGRVLIVDNELHPSVLASRIPTVAKAMSLPAGDYNQSLEIMALRGELRSLDDLALDLAAIEPGQFRCIVMDAKYRFLRPGQSENDNASEAAFYNEIDQIAEATQAAVVLVHHTSKGIQSDKRVTDVGAGAGAQSRAADCHLVLREHEDDGTVVLDAATRSFPPVEPLALRWEFPLWRPAEDVDPNKLKGRLTAGEQKQAERDKAGVDAILSALLSGPQTARQLRAATDLGRDRLQRLLDRLAADGHIATDETKIRGNTCHEYTLAE